MMDILDLRCVSEAASAGNFGRAARSLGLKTSTISRRIARLEDELGLTLFERTKTGVHLTTGGKALMGNVSRALAEFDAVIRSAGHMGSGHVGEIRLGVQFPPVGQPLSGLLAGWRARHPYVVLTIAEMNEIAIVEALNCRRLDVSVTSSLAPARSATSSSAASLPLYTERLVAALPHHHGLLDHQALEWADLRNENILIQEWGGSQRTRELFTSLLGRRVRFSAHPASEQSVFALVAAGFGITLVPASQAAVTTPGVMFLPIAEKNACLQVELVWRPELEDPAVGRFVAFLRDETISRRLV